MDLAGYRQEVSKVPAAVGSKGKGCKRVLVQVTIEPGFKLVQHGGERGSTINRNLLDPRQLGAEVRDPALVLGFDELVEGCNDLPLADVDQDGRELDDLLLLLLLLLILILITGFPLLTRCLKVHDTDDIIVMSWATVINVFTGLVAGHDLTNSLSLDVILESDPAGFL